MPLRSLFATRRPRRVLKAIGFQVVFYASALHIISFAVPTAWPWTEQPCYVKRSNEDESAGKAMTKRRDPSDASVNDVQVSLANMTLDPATYSPVPSNASGFVDQTETAEMMMILSTCLSVVTVVSVCCEMVIVNDNFLAGQTLCVRCCSMLTAMTIALEAYFFVMNCPSAFFNRFHLGLLLSAFAATLFLVSSIFYARFVECSRQGWIEDTPSYRPLQGGDLT